MPSDKLEVSKASALETSAMARPCVIAEFRGQVHDKLKWSEKGTGRVREMEKVNISGEFAGSGRQVQLECFPPMGESSVAPLPYAKGDLVLFELSHFDDSREKGVRGRVAAHSLFRARS